MSSPIPPGEPKRWLDDPRNRDYVFWFVLAMYVVFAFAGFLPYEKHPHFAFERLPPFAAIYGFVCCVGLVLAAKEMRKFLMRDEDYYDE